MRVGCGDHNSMVFRRFFLSFFSIYNMIYTYISGLVYSTIPHGVIDACRFVKFRVSIWCRISQRLRTIP